MRNNMVIFFGPPGSGKGTLSSRCIEQLNWVQLSTGNLCRKHIAEQTDVGCRIDAIIRAGSYVPDDLISSMVDQWLLEQKNQKRDIILDGYPRTVPQVAAMLDSLALKLPTYVLHVVRLRISDEKIIDRLSYRAVCNNKECQAVYSTHTASGLMPKQAMVCNKCSSELVRRADDERAAITARLKTYYKHEHDLIDYYQQKGIPVKELVVEKPIGELFEEFKRVMGLLSS